MFVTPYQEQHLLLLEVERQIGGVTPISTFDGSCGVTVFAFSPVKRAVLVRIRTWPYLCAGVVKRNSLRSCRAQALRKCKSCQRYQRLSLVARTTASEAVSVGSSPTGAIAHSSSGQGCLPLKQATMVRIHHALQSPSVLVERTALTRRTRQVRFLRRLLPRSSRPVKDSWLSTKRREFKSHTRHSCLHLMVGFGSVKPAISVRPRQARLK